MRHLNQPVVTPIKIFMSSVLKLSKEASSSMKIHIINNSSHDVKIQQVILFGHVFQIQSASPLERLQINYDKLQQLKIKKYFNATVITT